ncbi:MAG: PASTA domain-containing protein [Bacteroidaceae bacterium]|nr:PASTA domain-containing protein [Bacteroidaceae bacterium]MBR4516771.1 PASTA domain-containing protein [Bacteroidaceae bacterium]
MAWEGFKKKLFSPVVYWNLIAMVLVGIALCIGLWMWMTGYTMHGESVEVPEVKGMMLSDAEYELEKLELLAVVVDSAYVRQQPAGIVLEQTPGVGNRVKSGREIYLTINQKQTPTNTIPDIAGNCSRREAEARLRSLGFKIGPIEFVPGDPDWVIALKVNGREVYTGERVPCDAPVVIVVGNSDIGNTEDDFDVLWGDSLGDNSDVMDGYEEEL